MVHTVYRQYSCIIVMICCYDNMQCCRIYTVIQRHTHALWKVIFPITMKHFALHTKQHENVYSVSHTDRLIPTHTDTYIYTDTDTQTQTHIHRHTHTQTHARTHTHTHTHTRTHTHTQTIGMLQTSSEQIW